MTKAIKSGAALSRDKIVDAAIELLDAEDEEGLTFRALATHLTTGPGAIYWHVTDKSELVVSAGNLVIARALDAVVTKKGPRKMIRNIGLAIFEAIDAHPWTGTQLARNPWPTAMLQIFERIGQHVQALDVSRRIQFTGTMALVSYIVGESRQNAANGRVRASSTTRSDHLEKAAAQWKDLDARAFPFTRNVASQLREHDDREEFLAGIDLILAGIVASR